jgi:D-alanyl-lipoteichoic acid acyltransferase DltB (MBOAT superfamily)
MLFNNPGFFLFFAAVYLLYWALSRRAQNLLLLAASYIFYGWWDWHLLSLLFLTSISTYLCGLGIGSSKSRYGKKIWLFIGLVFSLGILGFFKYCNFFITSFAVMLGRFGFSVSPLLINVVLPVGISFYTLQAASYLIDVYRGDFQPANDLVPFLLFKSFFPQLVAGPIERASHMMPQYREDRVFDRKVALDGAGQVVWGLFKKVVVADNLSLYVNMWYGNVNGAEGWQLIAGTYFFAFQIYCDFSGYSDMAVGLGRMLGFNLTQNFRFPYFSQSPREFWSRWHVTLMGWFRDYIYIPLGGSRCSYLRKAFNILIVFSLSGLWHGASWTFVVWGLLNGIFFVLFSRMESDRKSRQNSPGGELLFPSFSVLVKIIVTFHLILITWIFFRADSLAQVAMIVGRIINSSMVSLTFLTSLAMPIFLIILMVSAEWLKRNNNHVLSFPAWPAITRHALHAVVVFVIVLFGRFEHVPFIYFQF